MFRLIGPQQEFQPSKSTRELCRGSLPADAVVHIFAGISLWPSGTFPKALASARPVCETFVYEFSGLQKNRRCCSHAFVLLGYGSLRHRCFREADGRTAHPRLDCAATPRTIPQ